MSEVEVRIAQLIMQIDQSVSQQVSLIIQHESFVALEARWRNLSYLIKQSEKNQNIKILLLTITKTELSNDLLNAMEPDHSQLFDKIYNQKFGIAGGDPFSVLIGDYAFSNNPRDIQILQIMSQISAAAFVPFIAAASAKLFGLNNFFELGKIPSIFSVFQQNEYQLWQNLRKQQHACFLALVLPQHLLRLPYNHISEGKIFQYHEPNPETGYLWGNAAYAFVAVIMKCFIETGWFGNIRGVGNEPNENGGNVPKVVDVSLDQRLAATLTTEAFITDSQEAELSELGFIPVCQQSPGRGNRFYSNNSLQLISMTHDSNWVGTHASSALQYLLCACRFVHYLKVIMRDKIGSFLTPEECENQLNDWLLQYVAANEDLGIQKRARFPLKNGLVKVRSSTFTPGIYHCKVYLCPFFQLEQLHVEFIFMTSSKSF